MVNIRSDILISCILKKIAKTTASARGIYIVAIPASTAHSGLIMYIRAHNKQQLLNGVKAMVTEVFLL